MMQLIKNIFKLNVLFIILGLSLIFIGVKVEQRENQPKNQQHKYILSLISESLKELGVVFFVTFTSHIIYTKFLQSEFTENLKYVIDMTLHMLHYGLKDVHKKIDHSEIVEEIFPQLEEGDTLRILDTFVEDVNLLTPGLNELFDRNVSILILTMDVNSDAVIHRCAELHKEEKLTEIKDKDQSESDNDLTEIATFKERLTWSNELIKKTIEDRSLGDGRNAKFEHRTYMDLPCVPMYLIEKRRKKKLRAYTGFFIGKRSKKMAHIEWEDGSSKEFVDYFDRKWENAISNNAIENVEGEYSYSMTAENTSVQHGSVKWAAEGTCIITQIGRKLSFTGIRKKEVMLSNQAWMTYGEKDQVAWESFNTYIELQSKVIYLHIHYIVKDPKRKCPGFAYLEIKSDGPSKELRGMCVLSRSLIVSNEIRLGDIVFTKT